MNPDVDTLTPIVSRVLRIEDVTWGDPQKNFIVRYRGQLYGDSEAAYDQLADSLRAYDITPQFRLEENRHAVILMPGIIRPKPSNIRWNIVMFVLTVASVLLAGAMYSYDGPTATNTVDYFRYVFTHLGNGVPFALCMMGILLAHEFGHYIAGRIHHTAVTLPYYIPLPVISPFGTMGAFIQLKEMPRNRRHLLDIAIAGPLAGFIVAIPILIYGLMTSPVKTVEAPQPGSVAGFEGNSILYSTLKFITKGQWLPTTPPDYQNWPPGLYPVVYFFTSLPTPIGGADVTLNGIAWAGWAGLLITALNLIPAGQLDGGHLLYVLLGKRAVKFVPYILGLLLLLGLVWIGWWLWAFLIFIFGRFYAEPLDQITPLDARRKAFAILGLVIFILIFTPVPLREVVGAVLR